MLFRGVGPHALPRSVLLAVAALLLLVGASPAPRAAGAQPLGLPPGEPNAAPQATRVSVGFLKTLADAPMVLARAHGHFAAAGIDVDLADFAVTADALPGLGTGQIDAVSGGVNPAIFNAVARGVPVKIVADGGSIGPDNDWYGVIVRSSLVDSGRYRGPADLRGLRVAVPGEYTVLHYVLKVLLERNGLTLGDVDLQPLSMVDHASAVNNGAVDAAFTIEPFITQAVALGGAVRVQGAQEITPYLAGGVVLYSPAFPARSADLVDRYTGAWLRGVADYNAAFGPERRGTDEAVQALRDAGIPINPSTQLPRFQPDGRFDATMMAQLLAWYQAEGVVPASVDLATIVDFSYVDRAAQRLGIAR
jgi:NitT/TauT family transport system substrate-binding protein